jgi:hypothetical protein
MKFIATVEYAEEGHVKHTFTSKNAETAENDLLDIMAWFGYDVVDYKIEEIK